MKIQVGGVLAGCIQTRTGEDARSVGSDDDADLQIR
jgi:hypothetical protein